MNKQKTWSVILAMMLISVLTTTVVPYVLARHEAAPQYRDVYWTTSRTITDSVEGLVFDNDYEGDTYYHAKLATGANELYGRTPLRSAVFVVEANTTASSQDPIIRVEVIIPQDIEGNALFNLKDSKVTDASGRDVLAWTSEIVEADANGWVRVYRFKTESTENGVKPLGTYEELYFQLYFSEGENECNYRFTVWTYDSEQEGHRHFLWLMMDKTPPRVDVEPVNGTTVNGLLAPCGNHYFILNVTAADDILSATGDPHDSGIKNASIIVTNATLSTDIVYQYTNSSINLTPGKTWIFQEKIWMTTRVSGDYKITATVWDGVGNKNTTTTIFTYIKPPSPLTITPSKGYAAPKTVLIDSKTWLVKSYPETYKGKTLGTLVTLTGNSFGASVDVSVRVYIPTYHKYFAKYGTYNVFVNQTKTKSDGTFTATFVFPKAPAGVYNVSAQSSVMECAVKFTVLPEIIFNPDEVVGPALIDVKATGFTAENMMRYSWFFILPDALQGVNTQADRWWYIDGNGTLVNALNYYTEDCEPPQSANTTLNWPFLEPGTYTVEIKHIDGDYWDGNTKTWIHKPCFAGSNKITVIETLGLLVEIKDDTAYIRTEVDNLEVKLDDLEPVITRIDGNVVTINSTVGRIEAKLSSLEPVITRIDGNVVEIKTTVGYVNTTLNTINPKIDTIKLDVATIKTSVGTDLTGKVVSIDGTVATIETKAGTIEADVEALPNLATPIYIAAILSLIAAIAAIACTILVYRKIA